MYDMYGLLQDQTDCVFYILSRDGELDSIYAEDTARLGSEILRWKA